MGSFRLFLSPGLYLPLSGSLSPLCPLSLPSGSLAPPVWCLPPSLGLRPPSQAAALFSPPLPSPLACLCPLFTCLFLSGSLCWAPCLPPRLCLVSVTAMGRGGSVSISVSKCVFPSLSERSVKLFKGYIIFDLYQTLPTSCTCFYLSV